MPQPSLLSDVERSDGVAPQRQEGQRDEHPPPRSWKHRLKAAKATAGTPRSLGISGTALLALSVVLIVTGLTLPVPSVPASGTQTPPPSTAAVNTSIPQDVLQPLSGSGLKECGVHLGDYATYLDTASASEKQYFGLEVANMSSDQVVQALKDLVPVSIAIHFWVLDSPSHPWSVSFQQTTALQVSVLNAAFSSMSLSFWLEGVHAIPATDGDVEGCGTPVPGGLISQLLGSVDTEKTIQVIVCDPAGVNGATSILGSNSSGQDPNAAGNTLSNNTGQGNSGSLLDHAIVIQRGALWQSRTTLIHQIGHFFGLPHPFPDVVTCSYDGDGIADTPQQSQGDTDCDAQQSAAPLCDPSLVISSGELPQFDFMDTTNDTCRQHFTPGQILRSRSMIDFLRPAVARGTPASGGQELPYLSSINPQSAFQSSLPPAPVVAMQLEAATTKALISGGTVKGMPFSVRILETAGKLTSSLDQAQLAIAGMGATTLDSCSCLGPDSKGQIFWTTQLDASYFIDAVQIVQPWEVATNSTSNAAAPNIDVWIGDSIHYLENAPCAGSPSRMEGLLQSIECTNTPPGRFVTIRWLPRPFITAEGVGSVQSQMSCMCDVTILSYVSPPQRAGNAAASSVPGALLNTTGASTLQSSSKPGASADQAVLDVNAASLSESLVPCSSTEPEVSPWWSMDLGLDTAWVNGVRLSVPQTCSGLTQQTPPSSTNNPSNSWNLSDLSCGNGSAVTLDIYVTNASFLGASMGLTPVLPPSTEAICAQGVTVNPGQVVDIACGSSILGHVTSVVMNTSAAGSSFLGSNSSNAAGAPLSLCGVRLFGGWPLVGAEAVSGLQQSVSPPALAPQFSFAVDGNPRTCVDAGPSSGAAGGDSTWWKARLHGQYDITGLILRGNSGKGLHTTLLDSANAKVADGAMSVGELLHVQPPVRAASINISGFATLCEVTLVASSQEPMTLTDDSVLIPHVNWNVTIPGSNGGIMNRSAVVDGDPRTCLMLANSSEGGSTTQSLDAVVEISLGGQFMVPAVTLLTNTSISNVEVAVAPTAGDVGNTSAWASCGAAANLQAWRMTRFQCLPAVVGTTVIITFPGGLSSAFASGPLALCEVSLPSAAALA